MIYVYIKLVELSLVEGLETRKTPGFSSDTCCSLVVGLLDLFLPEVLGWVRSQRLEAGVTSRERRGNGDDAGVSTRRLPRVRLN